MANNTTYIPYYAMNSSECLVLEAQDFVPWNNSDNIVSYRTETLVREVKDLIILPITFVVGVPGNVMNMLVFYKHGLKERINVCLFALSLADGLYLVNSMLVQGEQLYLYFTTQEVFGPIFRFVTNNNLGGFYGLAWVSQILSAIVSSERCFCILRPLKSQIILRTSTMTAIIIADFVVVTGLWFIVVTRYYVVCAYDPFKDSIILTQISSEFYYRNKTFVDFLDSFMYGLALPLLVILVVVSTTLVTVIKLRQTAQWRAGTSSSTDKVSARDIALTRMLVANSVFFIICLFPVALFRVSLIFVAELRAGQRYHNLYFTGQWMTNIFSYINSTFNIVVYYTMGSRYRQTFWTLIGRKDTKSTCNKS